MRNLRTDIIESARAMRRSTKRTGLTNIPNADEEALDRWKVAFLVLILFGIAYVAVCYFLGADPLGVGIEGP
jgi:hypothetical protein